MDLTSVASLHPRYEPEHHLLVLELDHGKANEMGSAQLEALSRLCDLLEADESVACLCTTSRRTSPRGTPIFIAGANVTERADWDDAHVRAHVVRQRELMVRLRRLPLFTTVLVTGVALGWGTEFVLTADYALATPAAKLGLPETGLGILPGARGTAELAGCIGPTQALRLGCTGEQIDRDEALRIGLINEGVDDIESGLVRVRALADLVRRRSPTAVAAYKHALLDGLGRSEAERLELEQHAYERCIDAGDAAVGRASFADVRSGKRPDWGPRRS